MPSVAIFLIERMQIRFFASFHDEHQLCRRSKIARQK
jgi:hypothetical protein